jgi:hydroxyacylglutathione hydrolase
MEIIRIPLGMHQANCYIVKSGNDLLIIDPGARADRIKTYLPQDAKITAILLTHGHFDHFQAVDDLVKDYRCPVYLHPDDEELLTDDLNIVQGKRVTITGRRLPISEGILRFGSIEMHVWETPGHSKGSVIFEIAGNLFSGDVLFRGGVGRTDLPGGNEREMKRSLNRIKTMDKRLVVHPGHGEPTTLEYELKTNPFLSQ